MDLSTIAAVIAGAGGLGVIVWVLAKLGRALITIAEALAAAAAVFLALWLVLKAAGWALRQTITHWRTSLTVVALAAWWQWWGWPSLALTAGVAIGVLAGWRLLDVRSFDVWAGRHLRSWWLRWTIYAPSSLTGCTPAAWASNRMLRRWCWRSLRWGGSWAAPGVRCPRPFGSGGGSTARAPPVVSGGAMRRSRPRSRPSRIVGEARIPARKQPARSLVRTAVRTWRKSWAPVGDQRICCF
jgi:hypothetical protein